MMRQLKLMIAGLCFLSLILDTACVSPEGRSRRSEAIRFLPPTSAAEPPGAEALSDTLPIPDTGLRIYVFNVGQADATFVVGPSPDFHTLLVDLGEPVGHRPGNFREVARRVEEITGETHIDYFLASHFHSDHVGGDGSGIAGLIDESGFTIGTVIDFGETGQEFIPSSRGTYHAFERNLARWLTSGKVTNRERPRFGTGQIDLSPTNGPRVIVDILASAGSVYDGDDGALAEVAASEPERYADAPASENDLSIAMEISYGDFEFFTAGDLTGAEYRAGRAPAQYTHRQYGDRGQTYTNVESRLAAQWQAIDRESDVEVCRVNHHGSAHSSLPDLVNRLDPEFMIYSTGGKYGHPSRPVVERGVATAWQLVTTKASRSTWPAAQPFEDYGEVVGEVLIEVSGDGAWYWINGETHKAYSDDEEDGGEVSEGGSGQDVDEEYTIWVDE
ncbi:MAG: hypothetical protein JSU86_12765 [Phycisphaerales bacterium]|nr:MAG: hypothetical protein JSU86_12765 [Phycisphaerales bacterium]